MNKWLQSFGFRINVNFVVFIVAAGGALGIALATVCIQGIRAAAVNPLNSLRNE